VPQTVASVLGIKEQAGQAMTQTLTSGLKDKKLLLLLDNCEHLLLACAQMVAALIRTCHNVTVLATSREALGIGGEYVYRIPSLSLPDSKMSKTATVASLSQFEAVRLFIDRAQAVRSDFAVTNQNAPALAQLCYRLDGIPLAIELAAARVRSLTVEQINDKLDSRFRLLTGGDRSALPRQQTLRALIDWSYDLLNETEKTLLTRLSVFAGGWILEAAEAVCIGDVVEDWEVLDLLTNLADKSLILSEETSGEQAMRYRMLETVRQYAQERLSASEEEREVREQHVGYFTALVEEAEPKLSGPEQLLWLNRLEAEHDNLRAALDRCAAEIDAAAALSGLRLTAALQSFWAVRDYLSEGRVHLARALAQRQVAEAGATDAPGNVAVKQAVARALNGAGTLAFFQSDYVAARAHYEQSLPLYREIGERGAVPAALMNIGNVAFCQGDYTAAQRVCQESLALLRELGDSGAIPSALMNVGYATFCLGDYRAARSLFEEGLVLCRESGNKQAIAGMLGNLGNVVGIQGDYSVARLLLEESLALQHEIGSKGGLADGLYYLGSLTFHEGDYPAAGALYDESLVLYREVGNMEGVLYSLSGRASVRANSEDEVDGQQAALRSAATLWGASGALEERLGAPLPPHYRSEQDIQVVKARAILNDDVAWTAAWDMGAALSWEQAVKLALRE
jgi:predicted ATPase